MIIFKKNLIFIKYYFLLFFLRFILYIYILKCQDSLKQIYIYIYIYVCMFYFVASDGTENKKISITCEDKEWFFTLDKTYEFGNKFYDLLEKDKSLTIQANLYSNPLNAAVMVDVNLSEEVPDISISVEAGDIIIYSDSNLFLDFFGERKNFGFSGLKVGELEKSSF